MQPERPASLEQNQVEKQKFAMQLRQCWLILTADTQKMMTWKFQSCESRIANASKGSDVVEMVTKMTEPVGTPRQDWCDIALEYAMISNSDMIALRDKMKPNIIQNVF